SSNWIAFLAITCTWVDKEWVLHETLLDFVEIKGAHSGENLGHTVYATLKEMVLVRNKVLYYCSGLLSP
ncbi:uncharacterized protein EI90DRAFT_2952038, partial [Cantharellus anzutake]|uniref:uncharacterized protein n=1 Tax=Cantharellus anzutake TaxID=1750568 RepID=UPI00190845CC